MKIGFFGGTFDPIHFGHINLAIQLLEIHKLDRVLFCPAFCSPHKELNPPIASPEDRMKMVQRAIQEVPSFHLCTIEIQRKGPSYTIDTLRALKEKEAAELRLYILLSEDALSSFHQWREPEEIVRLAQPLIGSRSIHQPIIPPSPVQEALINGLTETRQFEISSTQVRKRLAKGLYCGHLIPRKVLDYIHQGSLYRAK